MLIKTWCVGEGKYDSRKDKKAYTIWWHMLQRCYNPKCDKFNWYGKIGASVSENWFNFQNFAGWFYKNYKEGFFLDKDLKVLGNKLYSETTCEFIPREINALLTDRKAERGKYPLGVHSYRKRFVAQVATNKGSQTHLGVFDTPEEAFQAYKVAKENYIKEIANYHFAKGNISDQVYKNLVGYEVKPFPEENIDYE